VSADRPELERRLGLRDAVVLGLGSMVGAGIFAAVDPAAAVAGPWLPLAVVLAGLVAWLNATSSGRLAAVHPQAGGTYAYATQRLGRHWGHLAGWAFVVGKTASVAAKASAVGSYAAPQHARWVALAAVVVVTVLGTGGIRRGARLTRVTLALAVVALGLVVVASWAFPPTPADNPVDEMLVATNNLPWWTALHFRLLVWEFGPFPDDGTIGPYGVLQGAGLMFFAFAGYARIATLGEEVRDPRRTIPRAIGTALAITVALYLLVVLSVQHAAGAMGLPAAVISHTDAVAGVPGSWAPLVVRVGAVAAASGALLGLLLGVSRVLFAMARDAHLPWRLTHVRHGVPDYAELAVAAVVAVVVLFADLRHVIGFSSTTVLTYYAITHLAAWRLGPDEGRPPRPVLVAGVAGCVVLALTLPLLSVVAGGVVLLIGLVAGAVTSRRTVNPSAA
jgi:APA family basic amino acid/polyamine antiporter